MDTIHYIQSLLRVFLQFTLKATTPPCLILTLYLNLLQKGKNGLAKFFVYEEDIRLESSKFHGQGNPH